MQQMRLSLHRPPCFIEFSHPLAAHRGPERAVRVPQTKGSFVETHQFAMNRN